MTLQELIDATPTRGAVTIPPGEYAGPVRVGRSITIRPADGHRLVFSEGVLRCVPDIRTGCCPTCGQVTD